MSDGEPAVCCEYLGGLLRLELVAAHDPTDRGHPATFEQAVDPLDAALTELPTIDGDIGLHDDLGMRDVSPNGHPSSVAQPRRQTSLTAYAGQQVEIIVSYVTDPFTGKRA